MVGCSSLKKEPCDSNKACSWVKGDGCSKSGTPKTHYKVLLVAQNEISKKINSMSTFIDAADKKLHSLQKRLSSKAAKLASKKLDKESKASLKEDVNKIKQVMKNLLAEKSKINKQILVLGKKHEANVKKIADVVEKMNAQKEKKQKK